MAEQVQDTANFREEGKPVDLTKRVKMIATETAPHHKEGEETEMHPNLAALGAKNGWFTYANPADEKDTSNVSDAVLRKPAATKEKAAKATKE